MKRIKGAMTAKDADPPDNEQHRPKKDVVLVVRVEEVVGFIRIPGLVIGFQCRAAASVI